MSTRPDLRTLWMNICGHAKREFIRSPIGSFSYGSLADLIMRFCSGFDQEVLSPGDRVVILSANEPAAGGAFLAALLDGRVPVMLSPDSKPNRIRAICRSVEPAILVADQGLAGRLGADFLSGVRLIPIPPSARFETGRSGLDAARRGLARLFRSEAPTTALDLPAGGREPLLPVADETLAYILFTSGTTSSPNGVQISRNGLMAHLETLTRLFGYGVDSRIFNATPLAHTDGLVQGLLLAAANASALLRPGPFSLPNLETWLDQVAAWEATHFITNPTILALVYRFAQHDDYFDDERFSGILSSASTLRPELWEKLETRFGCSVFNLYGMTETVANATYAGRHPEMGPVGTIGVPVDCQLRLMEVRADGSQLESAVEGEIQLRGENVFQGYWKDSERTAETFMDGGWMRTGDLARRREDGGLSIIGRVKTMINMGGQSVMPEEIDEALATHAAVVDVATVGFADSEFEEVAVAAVVLERPTSETELAEHCRRRLEPLKVPKRILAVDRIPRGDAGKPKIAELHALLEPLLAAVDSADAAPDNNHPVSAAAVCAVAAEVFRISADELTADSSPATVESWDSFNQLNLMIEAENRFKVRIPAAQVASIRTLGDLVRAVNAQR